ncbi:hypothetical protein [Pacificimonas flava]|uniref:hypothetical protein n=1 Tax=Pacificimonas flava TaxID=1234595 RepID=UPI00056EEE6D|nr:hypothetical protein [Pacificimonas flava]MBB5281863.1 hypothetical protein [Pacificimonas flava]
MTTGEPFYFGISLIARDAARSWDQVSTLFAATLRSALSQTDSNVKVVLAAHDTPDCWDLLSRTDPRLTLLRADWPVKPPSPANDDAGAKKWRIKEYVSKCGGGLLMYLDADDLVDVSTVEVARQLMGDEKPAGLVREGFAIDAMSGNALAIPDASAFNRPFHQLCGSTTVARITPGEENAIDLLGSHHLWEERAEELRLNLAKLPLCGGYLVNSGENHSENQGPFADWRRSFAQAVAQRGRRVSPRLVRQLGVSGAEPWVSRDNLQRSGHAGDLNARPLRRHRSPKARDEE